MFYARPLPASTGLDRHINIQKRRLDENQRSTCTSGRLFTYYGRFRCFYPMRRGRFFSADTHECFYAVFEGYFFKHFHTFVSYRELHHHPRRGRGLIKEKEKRLMTRVGGCFCGNSCERGRSVSPLFLAFASKGQLDQKSNCVKANKRCTAQRSDTIVRG